MQPWVPWPDQSTVAANGFKAFEIAFDTLSHVIIELALFGAEVGTGNEREAHQISPRSVCSGFVRSARAHPYLRSMIGLTPSSYRSAAAKRLLHASTRMRGAHRADSASAALRIKIS